GREDDVCAIPAPHRERRPGSGDHEQRRAREREGPADRDRRRAEHRQGPRTRQWTHEHDPVAPCVDENLLLGVGEHGLNASTKRGRTLGMGTTAKRAAVVTLVAGGIVVLALALWKIRVVIALVFLGFIVAAAMRPGVDWFQRHRLPRGVGVLLHYLALAGVIALVLWLVVPPAISQVQQAIGNVPTTSSELHRQAKQSTGIKHELLLGLEKRLRKLPSGTSLVHPAVEVTKKAFEALVGIFRSEEHTSELQSRSDLVCRLLL